MKRYFNVYFLIPLFLLYNVIRINDSIRSRTLYDREDESSDILTVKSGELNNNHKFNIYNSDYENVNNQEISSFLENKIEKKEKSSGFINNKTKSNDEKPPSYSYRNDKFYSLSEIEENSGNTNSNSFPNNSEISFGNNYNKYNFIQKRTNYVCGIKRKLIKWVCPRNSKGITVCVPDRKIQLCIANFLNSDLETIDIFKEMFLKSVILEAKLLFDKHEGKYSSIFCNELRNSFSDYRSILIDDDMDFGGNTDKVKEHINNKFSYYYSQSNMENINEIKKKWWEDNKKELWNNMIEKYKGKISNECSKIPEDEPQINLWIKEWNEHFWMEKDRLFLNIRGKCAENKKYEACSVGCRLPCSSYTSFMNKSKSEMDVLMNLYKIKNPKENQHNFLNEVFKKNKEKSIVDIFKNEKGYDDLCDCKYTVTIIKSFLNGPARDNVDIASEINANDIREFGCGYKSNNKRSWNCTGSFTNNFPGICVPPRRHTLCLGRTYSIEDGNEDRYREHLFAASIYEAQLLKYRYKEKDENALCSIIQNSYADIADIIKGSDIVKDNNGKKMEENLNKVNKNKNRNEASLKSFREHWWEKNREDAWNVMSAVLENKEACKDSDKFQKIPQFLRWFKEWGDDFCQERKEKIYSFKSFKEECKKKDCEENTCKNKCNEYKKWIDLKKSEYDKQVEKYTKDKKDKIYDNIDAVKDKEAKIYLQENSTECKDVNFDEEIFIEHTKKYDELCEKCNEIKYLNEIRYPKKKHTIYDIDTLSDALDGGTPISINENINGKQNRVDASISESKELKDSNGAPKPESEVSSRIEKPSSDINKSEQLNNQNVSQGSSYHKSSERKEVLENGKSNITKNDSEVSNSLTSEIGDKNKNSLTTVGNENKSLLSTADQGNIVDAIKLGEESVDVNTDDSATRINVNSQSKYSGNSGTIKGNPTKGDNNEVDATSNILHNVQSTSGINDGNSEQSLSNSTDTSNNTLDPSEIERSDNQVNNSHSSGDSDSLTIEKISLKDNKESSHDLQSSRSNRHNTQLSSQSDDTVKSIQGLDPSRYKEDDRDDTLHISEELLRHITGEHMNSEDKAISNTLNIPGINMRNERSVNSHDFNRRFMMNNDEGHQYVTQIEDNETIRGQEKSEDDNDSYEDEQTRSINYKENYHKKNIEEYNSRDTKKVREEIIKLSKQNKCNNEYSMEYCTYSNRKNSSLGSCSKEEKKKLCCQISDYCLTYFNFYSIEYYNCMKSEMNDPEYKCFNSKGQSNMPYFAAGGILVIIVLLLSSATRIGKSNDEYILGESNMEAAFEENNYFNNLSRIFNQEVQETNASDFSQYNYNERDMY
ncbi:erythrocyte binding antigen-140 [Plasmodium gaboni]|uniref:Erythrocyte binding antigen-140 n=1 Tax=Plasmodium gaboni TaxID=647221 RepID=A0A151LCX3_9APIC|nr:erythrocyte binding antigen-140 [Plasmodium gaboni]KYN96820.1 erythrocyte binding antigen-140 [Plasmodium gaboni]